MYRILCINLHRNYTGIQRNTKEEKTYSSELAEGRKEKLTLLDKFKAKNDCA